MDRVKTFCMQKDFSLL